MHKGIRYHMIEDFATEGQLMVIRRAPCFLLQENKDTWGEDWTMEKRNTVYLNFREFFKIFGTKIYAVYTCVAVRSYFFSVFNDPTHDWWRKVERRIVLKQMRNKKAIPDTQKLKRRQINLSWIKIVKTGIE